MGQQNIPIHNSKSNPLSIYVSAPIDLSVLCVFPTSGGSSLNHLDSARKGRAVPNSDSAGSARGLADRRVSGIHTERDTAVSVCTVQCICTVQ